jgi:hypothetical protein
VRAAHHHADQPEEGDDEENGVQGAHGHQTPDCDEKLQKPAKTPFYVLNVINMSTSLPAS